MSTNNISLQVEGFQPHYPETFPNPLDERISGVSASIFARLKAALYRGIHSLIGRIVLPVQNAPTFLTKWLFRSNVENLVEMGGQRVGFKAADGIELDGMYFKGLNCDINSPTVILFNPNGVWFEQYGNEMSGLFDIRTLTKRGFNLLVFNYRGVGESGGHATRDGLILDGDAAFQLIRDRFGVPEDKIVLHGHSLGGGIAAEVAALHPQANFCSDRSFSSLSQAAESLQAFRWIGAFAARIIKTFGWEYDAVASWKKIEGHKWIIFHPEDLMHTRGASLHEKLEEKPTVTKLKKIHPLDVKGVAHIRRFNDIEGVLYLSQLIQATSSSSWPLQQE